MNHPLTLRALLATALFAPLLTQCKPKPEAAVAAETRAAAAPATALAAQPPAKPASMADHAAKLGFAGKLPQDTEFYLGSVNLKAHLDALKASSWWKDLDALVQDKTPAPTAGDKSMAALQGLWGDDVFLAGGRGFAAAAAQLRGLNRVYNEIYFKMMMSGTTSGDFSVGADDAEGGNPLLKLQQFLQDPATLEKAAGVLSSFELPPLLAGFKVEKPGEILAYLNDTKALEEKKIFTMSDLTTKQGHKFRVATVEMTNLLPESGKQDALSKLPDDTPEASRKVIEKAYDDLRGRKFLLAWGEVEGRVLLACGQNLDHVTFAESPAASLLARPELAWLLPHVEKNLAALTFMSGASLAAVNDDQPIVPMLRGVVSALKENATFKTMGATLEQRLNELAPLESKVYATEATNLVGAAWWDRGLHAEFTGGLTPRFLVPGKPLRFSGLVDRPGVVFGLAYHRNHEHEQNVRAWLEKLIGLAYTTAQELIKAGIAGPNGGQQFALFELMLLPTLQKLYQADKDIDQKGLGSEIAYILDVNGKMPSLPGVTEADRNSIAFPRLSSVCDVASRKEIASGWKVINETVTNVATIISGFAGAQAGAQGKPPFLLPQPQSSQAGDLTTWFYTGEFFSGDLSPSAAISDRLLVLSTSRTAAESFAADLAKPPGKTVDGAAWRLDLGALAIWLGKASSLNPSATPEQTKEVRQNLNWLKPFHAMQGRIYQENGQWRTTVDWDISDVVKFD